ncbi:metallophosphoesterase family protein [Catelliglobosispora koreensis]|uniref:metallophosphoesterase family protein n=1 Tax=Catelliglobosispora koreensis TaxID=129052 RepID=UPI000373F06A|nr:metallophosphoesterase [Catelliglobosispora koreensis]
MTRTFGWRQAGKALIFAVVVMAGALLGLQLAGPTAVDLGPFRMTFSLQPSLAGDTQVLLPPLGSLQLDTHEGPAHLQVRLDGLDRTRTEALINDPASIRRASQGVAEEARAGINRLVLRTVGVGVLGAMLAAALMYRRTRPVAWAGGLALAVLTASLGSAALSFNPKALQEPRYDGLLANAPAIVGDAQRLADKYDEYAAQLEKMVVNVGTLYNTVSNLPVYTPDDGTIRVLHVSDLHLNPAAWSVIRSAVEQFHINVVVDTGDINDWGTEMEASFVASIALLGVPYVYVRGNHDSAITQAAVAAQPNAIVLDNQVAVVNGLTIAGIGDPRFTPDKGGPATDGSEVKLAGEALAKTISGYGNKVDLALVHDPESAPPLAGLVPTVLAGHAHGRSVTSLEGDGKTTRLMVQGSTGGAGLRGLEHDEPNPLAMSVLYFDPAHELVAYDDISVGGTGLAEVSLKRHIIAREPLPNPSPSAS